MEEVDKGCPMIRMGVSGLMFLLVPAYPGSPGQKAIKWLCVCVCVCVSVRVRVCVCVKLLIEVTSNSGVMALTVTVKVFFVEL